MKRVIVYEWSPAFLNPTKIGFTKKRYLITYELEEDDDKFECGSYVKDFEQTNLNFFKNNFS